MNSQELFTALAGYRNDLFTKKMKLRDAKIAKDRRDAISKCLDEAKELQEDYRNMYDNFDKLDKITHAEDTEYRKRRLGYLNQYITNNLALIFPNEGYTAKIKCDFKYNYSRVTLNLYNKHGEVRIPKVSEGMMCQELIGFSASVSLAECLGKNMFYMDEAFAVSDKENLQRIGQILQSLIDKGFQIFLIEQHAESYKDLKRREIHLIKDPIENAVKVKAVLDL